MTWLSLWEVATHSLVVRADADSNIGGGHLMRGLALAYEWNACGGKVVFVTRCQNEALRDRIRAGGFEIVSLEDSHPSPSDLETTATTLDHMASRQARTQTVWVALDGRHFGVDYQRLIRRSGSRLLVMDDGGSLPIYHADLLHNQSIEAPTIVYQCEIDCKLLLGTEYVLLRPEFMSYLDWKRVVPDVARKVLVTMGAANNSRLLLDVLRCLVPIASEIEGLEAKVVGGGASHGFAKLEGFTASLGQRIEILESVGNMAELMAWADVGVIGGGTTVWEAVFMQLPCLVLQVADDQKAAVDRVVSLGLAYGLAPGPEGQWLDSLGDRLLELIKDLEMRQRLAGGRQTWVDGRGAARVVDEMLKLC
jgi:UDP-2,4-diacetamido-2,4,6-trideoxy-beta-L-altropyranose hydrolase